MSQQSFDVTMQGKAALSRSWGAVRERIEKEIHKPTAGDHIQMAMISAMEWFAHHEFWFNQATHTFSLTTDQQEYPQEDRSGRYTESWPEDILRPIATYVQVGGTRWLKLNQGSIDDIRWYTPTEQVTGVPDIYAWFDEKIWFAPIPNTSQSSTARIDYVQDVGIPRYEWLGTEWAFYFPKSNVELTDNFRNAWTENAEELIRCRAKYDLYLNFLDDMENAQKMEHATNMALGQLRSRQAAFNAERGRIPDYL